jgi:hypothetical protein
MKNIIRIIVFSFIVFSQSCVKPDSAVNPILTADETLIQKFLNVTSSKGGSVIIRSDSKNFKKEVNYESYASFKEPIYDAVQVDDITLMRNIIEGGMNNQYAIRDAKSKNSVSKLFGKEIKISLDKSGISSRDNNSGTLYSPTAFDMNGGPRNTSLSWNADPNNSKVYILIMFDSRRAINDDFKSYSSVERYIETNDDGSHQLTEADFSNIPFGADVQVIVARGRTAVIGGSTNGQGSSVQAISTVSITGTYMGGGGGGTGDGGGPTLHVL